MTFLSHALADTTTFTLADSAKGTSNVPVSLQFPLARTGDLGYDAILTYHTIDDTAFAGTDYVAVASGSIVVPAGSATATIPVTLLPNTGNSAGSQLQLAIDSVLGIGPAPTFSAQQTFATGSSPYAVATADLNGDGLRDLIVANSSSSTVSVLLNTAAAGATAASFSAQQTFAVGSNPHSVTIADVNGDGKPDLIVANTSGNSVSVLLNTTAPGATTPSFAAQQTFATGTGPISVTTADLNGDGRPDLIVANENSNTVSILLNTTTPGATAPSFATQQTFSTQSAPVSVTAADVNGDGKPDLIVANYLSNTVSVLLNTTATGATTPGFAAQQTFATGTSPFCVTTADVDGDGKLDLIVANNAGNSVSVLLNTTVPGATTLGFSAQQTFATGNSPLSVITTDVNGDGKPDLVVVNSSTGSNSLSVLVNITLSGASTASFSAQRTFATGSSPSAVAAADVNGDGMPDLIATNYNNNNVSVLLNATVPDASTADFSAQQSIVTALAPRSVTTADINGDGKPDVIVAGGADTVSVMTNATVPGANAPSFTGLRVFAAGTSPYSVTTADLNGDGKPDIIAANYFDNTVSVLLNTASPGGNASFSVQQTFATGAGPFAVTAADVNGDGKPDLIVANYNGNTVSVLLNTTAPGATATSFAAQQTFTTGSEPRSVAAVDVNGDGKPDLIVANYLDNSVSVLLNTTAPGAASPSFATQQTFAVGSTPYCVTTADVNGDGKPDVIVANYGGSVSVLLNTTAAGAGTPAFGSAHAFGAGPSAAFVTAVDVNGDGRPDLIVANYTTGAVTLLLNATTAGASTPSFTAGLTLNGSGGPLSVAAADINGDGKPDLILANSTGNFASAVLSTQYQTLVAGSPAIGTIVHDYIFASGFEP